MYNKSILLILYIIYYFQIVYCRNVNGATVYAYNNITNYDLKENYIYTYNESKSKEEVLNIINSKFYHGYYCKNNICVLMDNKYIKPFIEIPDERGNIKLYNIKTFSYDTIKLNNNDDKSCVYNDCISYKCTNDSECLYDKCIDNYCVFNEKAPVIHCDNIYLGAHKSYMYCGKAFKDICSNDDECSSKKCEDGFCDMQRDGPSDSEGTSDGVIISVIFTILWIVSIIVFIICYIHYRKNKHSDKKINKRTYIFMFFSLIIILFFLIKRFI